MNYPELKCAVWEQAEMYKATLVLIEDKASGTQLIQELVKEGLRIVKPVKPEGDKTMRFNAQTATIENGFVYLPQAAHWLVDFIYEVTTFPAAKYDDQADSISQALEWINKQPAESGWITYMQHELARDMYNQGDSIEKIAGYFDKTEEEIKSWIKAQDESKARIQEIINQRNLPRCQKCGKVIPYGIEFVHAGGDYHKECWRKMTYGQ